MFTPAIPAGVSQSSAGEEGDGGEIAGGTEAVWSSPDQEQAALPLCLHRSDHHHQTQERVRLYWW